MGIPPQRQGPRRSIARRPPQLGHVNREALVGDAKFPASAKVGCDLCTMDDVLAWQAGDVRTRSTNVFAIDNSDALSFSGKCPGGNGRSSAAAENHKIKLFRLGFRKYLSG